MSLQLSDLDRIATLSHLYLTEEERQMYLGQLQLVLGHMDALNQLSVPAFAAEVPTATPERDDVVTGQPDLLLSKNAPHWEAGCFRVPKMLEDA